ncbi:MAG: non-ribosomal peptide synthetase, partial [bacterium]|nr:non-ribosomal peptide synthetase [bacterium]
LFEEQVQKTPDNVAIVGAKPEHEAPLPATSGEEPYDKRHTLTYSQLNEQANRLAGKLIEKGVKPGNIVAIMVERSVEMMVGIFAILKAAGAYLPILPYHPAERITFMLKDSSATLMLTTAALAKKINVEKEIIYLERLKEEKREMKDIGDIEELREPVSGNLQPATGIAYIIYTSGSTGTPKGVMVEHASVVNILTALQKAYPLRESDTYLLKTSYIFDVSVTEIFGWFLEGGRLALLERDGEKVPRGILAAIKSTSVTHINFVPSLFNLFLDTLETQPTVDLTPLKYIFLAGEELTTSAVERFKRLNTGIPLENIYGPTEATIYAARYSLTGWDGTGQVPIGKPMRNLGLYILDKYDNIQPVGVPGELCINGAGLARGYLNRPELTSEKFRKHKLQTTNSSSSPLHNNHLYHTGDLARWRPDGNIEYLGRIDFQVKIRGFRIELGEICSQLMKHESVKEAVVIDRTYAKRDETYLCAYITAVRPLETGQKTWPLNLRQYLARTLPDYMIPSYFVEIEEIPLTPTGKVDRKALLKHRITDTETGEEYIAPRGVREKTIAAIWKELLELEDVGVETNFFESGGNSLNVVQLADRLKEEFNVDVPAVKLFQHTTIAAQAAWLGRGENPDHTGKKT